MDRLLVIGGSGLLGSKVVEIAKKDYEVFGTYNKHLISGNKMYKLDTCNRQHTFELIEKLKPDCVIDAHGIADLDYCEVHNEEAWQSNVDSSKNAAEACKKIGAKYMFISTDNVFDGRKLRYTEKDSPHPLNYYAKTKVVMEHILPTLDVNYIIARTTGFYGTGGFGKVSFTTWLINKLKNKEQVRIVTDQRNNATLTDNLTEFLLELYQKDAIGTFNITGKDCISKYDLANKIATVFGLDKRLIKPITIAELNLLAPRPGSINMVTNKVERITKLKPLTVDEGLSILKKQMLE